MMIISNFLNTSKFFKKFVKDKYFFLKKNNFTESNKFQSLKEKIISILQQLLDLILENHQKNLNLKKC